MASLFLAVTHAPNRKRGVAGLAAAALLSVCSVARAEPVPAVTHAEPNAQPEPSAPVTHAESRAQAEPSAAVTHAQPSAEVAVRHTQVIESAPASKLPPDPEALALAAKIDAIVYEAVQDLGLDVDISQRASRNERESDDELLASASESWVVAPRLERKRGAWLLRIIAVPPGSRVLYTASQIIESEGLEKRVVLMMRDLVEAARGAKPASPSSAPTPHTAAAAQPTQAAHSPGRAILAVNSAVLGGFVGYSLQRASGSTDDRLTYPLAALGAGVGLGSAMLVAEEWDIEVGDAWFLSAGMLWPTLSASLIARGYSVSRANGYAYGLLGATAGITLATTALGFGHVSDGGAALAHSGGVFGTLVGGLIELSIEGETDLRPRLGMGYGAGAGVVVAGAIATQVSLSPSRVLMIDLGASLGALTGAAAASPLLLVDESAASSRSRNRLWLASVAAGTLVGGAAGAWFTRSSSSVARLPALPTAGIVAVTPEGEPAYGGGIVGRW
ncbi:MAG: hypothetical protein ACOY0T_15340 [Myxococcota bacterium]